MLKVKFTRKFSKTFEKTDAKIKKAFREKLNSFLENPFYPLLNNHGLTGEYSGCRSINITGDWRAIYRQTIEDNESVAIFEVIGTHSQLYR